MTRFRFIAEEAAEFPVSLLCRCVGVTRQGYYAWRRRPPSPRSVEDARLGGLIRQIYDGAFAVYGAPRIHAELRLDHGERVSRKRVARIMRELGLRGVDGRRGGPQTLR